LQKNTPIDNQDGYAFCLTAIVDEIGNGSSQVFLKQSKNDSSSIYAFSFDNSGITGKRLIDKVPSNDKAAVSAMVLSNDASQLAVVVDKSKPRFLFRSPKNCELRIYDINSSYDSIVLSDSLVFNQNYISSLAYSQNNTYLYYQKQDMQGNAALHRYNLNSQSSEAITAVTAQGKLRYADSLLYIMHDSKIEVLEYTDNEDFTTIPVNTINASSSFRYSGLSSSSTIGMHGSFTYGYDGNTYYRCLAKQYELKDHLGNVRVVISDVKEPNANYDQFTADLQAYYNYYAFGMLQPSRHYTLAEEYKFGFQGQLRDDDIKGDGNSINYKYRMHDPRLGRFFAIDPLTATYPHYSPYSFSGNRVIDMIELEGLEPTDYTLRMQKENSVLYKALFRDNFARQKDGYNVYLQLGTRDPLLVWEGEAGKNILVNVSRGSYSRTYPNEVPGMIEKMTPKYAESIPQSTDAPVLKPINNQTLAYKQSMSNSMNTPSNTRTTGSNANIPINTPIDLNIDFTGKTAFFSDGNQAMQNLRGMVSTLNSNPDLSATISVSTDYKVSGPTADKLLLNRGIAVKNAILAIDPNFDMSRITPGQPQYNTTPAVNVTYKTTP